MASDAYGKLEDASDKLETFFGSSPTPAELATDLSGNAADFTMPANTA